MLLPRLLLRGSSSSPSPGTVFNEGFNVCAMYTSSARRLTIQRIVYFCAASSTHQGHLAVLLAARVQGSASVGTQQSLRGEQQPLW